MARDAGIRQDGGWAWVVMVAAFACFMVNGVVYSLGVYVAELIIEQDLDKPSVALFGSLQIAFTCASGLSSYLSEQTSHRLVIIVSSLVAATSTVASVYIKSMTVLYVTFGVIPGFCLGTIGLQGSIVLNQYFTKRSGFANCFILSGCAAGTLIFPPVFRATIEMYGWRSSLYIVAAVALQGCVLAMCMRPVEFKKTATERHKRCTEIYQKPNFYLFQISSLLLTFSWPIVFVFSPALFYENNMTGWQVDVLMIVIGACNVFGRIGSGFVSTVTNWNPIVVHIVAIVCMATSFFLFVIYPCITLFVVASVLFGTAFGSETCTQCLISRHIGGFRYYGTVYSWSYFVSMFGCVFGPFLSGYIYEATLSYTIAYLFCAGLLVLAGAVMAVAFCLDRKARGDSRHVHTDMEQARDKEISLESVDT